MTLCGEEGGWRMLPPENLGHLSWLLLNVNNNINNFTNYCANIESLCPIYVLEKCVCFGGGGMQLPPHPLLLPL